MPIFKQDGGSNKEWGEISTSGRTWLFVSTEIPVNTIQCAMENPQFRMFEEGEADNTGGIQLVFEELDFLAAQLDEVSAVIDASMLEPTASWTGTIVGIHYGYKSLTMRFNSSTCNSNALLPLAVK